MTAKAEKTYFEQQRELVLTDVAASLERVLQNINKLNRSVEGVIAVGNEFSQVEGLWSQFENVMASNKDGPGTEKEEAWGLGGKDAKEGAQEG